MKILRIALLLGLVIVLGSGLALGQNRSSAPTINKHAATGITCEACHGQAHPSSAPKAEQCSSCHGDYKKLKSETAKLNPNPHDLFHLGSGNLRCSMCHKNHAASKLLCNDCHVDSRAFKLQVP